ncbi:MAG TPA: hypothetical protein VN428_03260 [Bryobacteraceae bacterium]|nr:hypothetical protein [Bryobacteraceae bacterium]
MPERIAMYTTVYPGVEPFLHAWHASVLSQTDRSFDLWIGADGLTEQEVASAIGEAPRARWVHSEENDTPAMVRQRTLEALVEDYDAVVFVDSDDVLCPSRVDAARRSLADVDVNACALALVDERGLDLGMTFTAPDAACWDDLLPRTNVFGLSNSAYRCNVLRECLPIPRDCSLIDWFLVVRAWANGARLSFDPAIHMRYRQHANNAARVLPPFSTECVSSGGAQVLRHYYFVLESGIPMAARVRQRLEAARSRAARFYSRTNSSHDLLERYADALAGVDSQRVWWWWIACNELEHIWNT